VADGVLPAGVRLVPVVGELLLHQGGVPVSSQHTQTSLRTTVSRDFFSLDSFMETVPPRPLMATLKDSTSPPPHHNFEIGKIFEHEHINETARSGRV
jgi:hypothetical protein